MTKSALFLMATLAGCALIQPSPIAAAPGKTQSGVALGTFDSRLVALAFYRSADFQDQMASVHAEHARAAAEGDAATVSRIEKEMPLLQERTHSQVFSTAPVPEILALIEGKIPAIAQGAGVQAIASRWDLVWQEDGLAFPDISFEMAALFHPDAETLKLMKDLAQKPPEPWAELAGHDAD